MQKKIKAGTKDKDLSLKDLLNIEEWTKIQDSFSAIANVGLRLLDAKGLPLTATSGESRLCSQLLRENPAKAELCTPGLANFFSKETSGECQYRSFSRSGLHNFIMPLKAANKTFGYIVLGPVILVTRKTKEEYRQIAQDLNLDLEDYWSAILEIKVMSLNSAQSMIELVRDVCEHSIKLAYQNLMKKRTAAAIRESAKLKHLLNTLLDVAVQVTGADIGSIMLIDKHKGELTIRTAKGLSKEIIRKTKLELGASLAGIVAEEGKPILIDDKTENNRIKQFLKRPSLGSSMILPIKALNQTLGVINLGASRSSSVRFNSGNIRIVDSLIDLATFAFQE